LAIFAVHTCVVWLHQFPPVQSASSEHAPGAWQLPVTLHDPERQTFSVSTVQGASPVSSPHALSFVSQTPLAQTDAPVSALHVPERAGV
jgi:hypothetical protein